MELDEPCQLITLSDLARFLRVPVARLRSEAEAGRLPHLKAGHQFLFDPDAVQRVLRQRAASEGMVARV